jgi:RNA polymerase sigma-70 factor (ECF subfamily)
MGATTWQRDAQDATDEDIRLCVAGDAQAWERLVRTYQGRIYGICLRFTSSNAEAEDLTQDIFVKLFCNLSSYDATRGSFLPWLQNLTRNHLVDRFRRTRVFRASSSLDVTPDGEENGATMAERLPDPRPSQEEHFAKLEIQNWVHAAVNRLSACSREAIVLCALEERDHKEAARILRIQEGTVKSRLSRGRAELARLLSPAQPVRV